MSRLEAGVQVVTKIQAHKRSITGATVLEVGTGRRLNLPIALWLAGAGEITTLDLNPYLREGLVLADVRFMETHRERVQSLFSNVADPDTVSQRPNELTIAAKVGGLREVLNVTRVDYGAPQDAERLTLPDGSIDFHVSYTTLEHIPPFSLVEILNEGSRVLRPTGLHVHKVDFSDHFSHTDPSISSVNFLQFSEQEWEGYAGNRFMYHNRLRVDEFLDILPSARMAPLSVETTIDQRALDALLAGLPLIPRFAGKAPEFNACKNAWVVASVAT